MDAIFLNSKISKTFTIFKGENRTSLSNVSIYYTWKNIKSLYNNNKFKISAPT